MANVRTEIVRVAAVLRGVVVAVAAVIAIAVDADAAARAVDRAKQVCVSTIRLSRFLLRRDAADWAWCACRDRRPRR